MLASLWSHRLRVCGWSRRIGGGVTLNKFSPRALIALSHSLGGVPTPSQWAVGKVVHAKRSRKIPKRQQNSSKNDATAGN